MESDICSHYAILIAQNYAKDAREIPQAVKSIDKFLRDMQLALKLGERTGETLLKDSCKIFAEEHNLAIAVILEDAVRAIHKEKEIEEKRIQEEREEKRRQEEREEKRRQEEREEKRRQEERDEKRKQEEREDKRIQEERDEKRRQDNIEMLKLQVELSKNREHCFRVHKEKNREARSVIEEYKSKIDKAIKENTQRITGDAILTKEQKRELLEDLTAEAPYSDWRKVMQFISIFKLCRSSNGADLGSTCSFSAHYQLCYYGKAKSSQEVFPSYVPYSVLPSDTSVQSATLRSQSSCSALDTLQGIQSLSLWDCSAYGTLTVEDSYTTSFATVNAVELFQKTLQVTKGIEQYQCHRKILLLRIPD
eukprot:TRINITY_DN5567_c0_g1_i2.p1 TRINITY_DN5567_c0_g1~~TRINITY_DN5567_c0_g1_i2.p1  ORF type:complete len:388 (-),score=40.16 TRINITY_DN5567_c0_g1_i2:24-1118(-)